MNPQVALEQAQTHNLIESRHRGNKSADILSGNLRLIVEFLEPLFYKLFRKPIKGSPRKDRHSKALLVRLALVEDESHMEQELAIVSLFHQRGLSLRDAPRNVLLCSSFTTYEEVHLLLLRCFHRTGAQDVGLFCIATLRNY